MRLRLFRLSSLIPLFGCGAMVDSEPRTTLTEVDAFERSVHFATKDTHLSILDVSEPGAPMPLFGIPGTNLYNSQVAVSAEPPGAFVSDGRVIYRVGIDGNVTEILDLGDIDTSVIEGRIDQFRINWFFATPDSGRVFYFALLSGPGSQSRTKYVCRLDVERRELDVLSFRFPSGMDVDMQNGTVYVPPTWEQNGVLARNFAGTIDRLYDVSHDYAYSQLSPDRTTLLLSCSVLSDDSAVATMDVANGEETVLSFEGACAVWGRDGSILFMRGENSLWMCTSGDDEPERLILVGSQERLGKEDGSYAHPPTLSADKSLVAWGWAAGRSRYPKLGTILIDLDRQQYRSLDGWWHNVQWITSKSE